MFSASSVRMTKVQSPHKGARSEKSSEESKGTYKRAHMYDIAQKLCKATTVKGWQMGERGVHVGQLNIKLPVFGLGAFFFYCFDCFQRKYFKIILQKFWTREEKCGIMSTRSEVYVFRLLYSSLCFPISLRAQALFIFLMKLF